MADVEHFSILKPVRSEQQYPDLTIAILEASTHETSPFVPLMEAPKRLKC